MKIELSKDPLFGVKQSPVKQLKERQLERQRNLRINRINPAPIKKQTYLDIIDPLPKELQTYKQETSIPKTFEFSKASNNLRKYIYQQQKNLKCLRLKRIQPLDVDKQTNQSMHEANSNVSNSRYNSLTEIEMGSDRGTNNQQSLKNRSLLNHSVDSLQKQFIHSKKSRNSGIHLDFLKKELKNDTKEKPINIPKIEQLFKDQQKQYVLYESKIMKNSLANAILSIDKSVQQIKKKPYIGMASLTSSHADSRSDQLFPPINSASMVQNQQDMEIDVRIQKKLKKSKKLRQKMEKQKKQLQNHHHNSGIKDSDRNSVNFFLSVPKKAKKTVMLEGVKSIKFEDGDRVLNITPASSLLFELNKLGKGKLRKQKQLSGLLNNSYKNREDILEEKSIFYQQQTPFNSLSPSNQFRLRVQMDKKLVHRLELSREQINNFISYLYEIKDYHVILGNQILAVLAEVREELIGGKVMKIADLKNIVTRIEKQYSQTADNSIFKGHPNELIISKLYGMMI